MFRFGNDGDGDANDPLVSTIFLSLVYGMYLFLLLKGYGVLFGYGSTCNGKY